MLKPIPLIAIYKVLKTFDYSLFYSAKPWGLSAGLLLGLWTLPLLAQENFPQTQGVEVAGTASTYQPGFWQPVARVNPKEPIAVTVMNETGKMIEIGLTNTLDYQRLATGDRVTLESVPLNSHLLIYPPSGTGVEMEMHFDVTSNGNEVLIQVTPRSAGNESHRGVNIDTTGAIYVH